MKLAQILLACIIDGLIATSVSAQGFCVAENGGCRDIQTGKLYVPDGNKLVDPETKQVYMENPPVETNPSKVYTPQTSGYVVPEGTRDPVTGRIIQPGKRVEVQETERMPVKGTADTWTDGPVPFSGTATREYTRATTCQGLKSEIDGLNRKWSMLKDSNRADVGKRIDKLEAEYQAQCR